MRRAKEAARLISLYPVEPLPRFSPPELLSPEVLELLERYRGRYNLPSGHSLSYMQIRGYVIALHRWLPAGPPSRLVLITHGYQSHTGLLSRLIRALLDSGSAVAAVDLPGHGLSTGPRGAVDLIADYRRVFGAAYRAFTLRDPDVHGLSVTLVGTSTGCTVMTDWFLSGSRHVEPENMCFLSPLIRPRLWPLLLPLEPLGRAISAVQRIRRRRVRERSHKPSREPSGVERLVNLGIPPAGTTRDANHAHFIRKKDPLYARRVDLRYLAAISAWSRRIRQTVVHHGSAGYNLPKPRLTIIQGSGDKLVAFRHNLRLLRALFLQNETHLIHGAHHDLLHDAEPVPTQVIDHILSFL